MVNNLLHEKHILVWSGKGKQNYFKHGLRGQVELVFDGSHMHEAPFQT